MGWLCNAVECLAKIAMTALRIGGATMDLLPDHHSLRLIIPDTGSVAKL
jgi:hypothetical protein